MRKPRSLLISLTLVAFSMLLQVGAAQSHPVPPIHVASLGIGDEHFWDGERVEDTAVFWELCGIQGPCWNYTLDVTEPGGNLRVALDFDYRNDRWGIRLRPPGVESPLVVALGQGDMTVENVFYTPSGITTQEIWVNDAPVGTYDIMVVPLLVEESQFRMRAKLEAAEAADSHKRPRPELPNLVTIPPNDFTFAAPVFFPPSPDHSLGHRDVAGVHPQSCTEDEVAQAAAASEEPPLVCLRFAAGGYNAGDGPFMADFDIGSTKGPVTQVIRWSDGSKTTRPGGSFVLHPSHGHFHYDNALTYELHRVTNEDRVEQGQKGRLEPAGAGKKTGYCPADYFVGEWYSFDQDRQGDALGNCGLPHNLVFGSVYAATSGGDPVGTAQSYEGRFGWTKGWGDVYPKQRGGQYVDFGENGPGLYVVRALLDVDNNILETNENDNVGYALVRVTRNPVVGFDVEILERGHGLDPWDPHKKVLPLIEYHR